ncbi:F0F1 ATP synthase subunit gamma [Boudabousia liubingyangii]|uniref:F0F1 ATP synthase subunit gamma n=1 Tax=Boudabousia liubingyangii TaxID=1921764 RepID=UPI0009401834|nr:F0F1 ATP synthase subunit gamma [Boudabousia liubingyangii]OKL46434.1 F0F1 ATP synthase subunit gamma [Boudabousia liubingyangii]
MGGKQRIYKQRIRSTETLKKVFRAMELIAASRIGKARAAAGASTPFAKAITDAVAAVALHSDFDHPLTRPRTDTNRVAIVCVTADRGMAGAYSAVILRETEALIEKLKGEGKDPVLYVCGRRGDAFFRFRGVPIARSWTGESDAPSKKMTSEVSDELLERFLDPNPETGVAEVHLVFTVFHNMVKQSVEDRQMLPLTVVDEPQAPEETSAPVASATEAPNARALYEFDPSPEGVLDQVLPLYVFTRIDHALLQSAASELASRQRSMHTATDNAQELITNYTRLANSARQAEITQEISEIVSGADALNNAR